MHSALKWSGIVVGGVLLLAVLVGAGLYIYAGSRLNRVYVIQPEAVVIGSDAAAIERGRHWVSVHCASCHGENLAGTAFFDDPVLAKIPAGNLTSGKGGTAGYRDEDWVRAMRYGIGRDGKSFLIMPSNGFYWLSDQDLGDIIAYLKQVPAVDNDLGGRSLSPLAHILFVAGAFGNALVAEVIDHSSPRPAAPAPGLTVQYGEYLVKTGDCAACHGANLTGGKSAEPGAPFAPDLTRRGSLSGWTEADFIKAFKSRDTRWMPYKSIATMSDDELKAMWLYLRSL